LGALAPSALFILALSLLLSLPCAAQSLRLHWVATPATWSGSSSDTLPLAADKDSIFWRSDTLPRLAKDSAQARTLLAQTVNRLHIMGYASASIDSIAAQRDSSQPAPQWRIYLHLGKRYTWAHLHTDSLPADWLRAINYRPASPPIAYSKINALIEKFLQYSENNGYPFAQIWLSDLRIDPTTQQLSARLRLDKGSPISIGKIHIEPQNSTDSEGKTRNLALRLRPNYLRHYLDLRQGSPYDERSIANLRRRLQALPFAQVSAEPYIVFDQTRADIHLFVRPRRANRFDFLIGVQPSTTIATQGQPVQQRLSITGNILIDLQNAFASGERLHLSWQRFQTQTSQLRTRITLPYLLRSPFGIDAAFELYRRDSTYIDIIGEVGAQYLLQGGNYLKTFWRSTTTNVTHVDTTRLRLTRRLPPTLDTRTQWVGFEYTATWLDERYNPRKGWALSTNLATGRRSIRPNIAVLNLSNSDFDFSTLYDTLLPPSYQVRLLLDGSRYQPIGKTMTLLMRLQTGYLFASRGLYQNELFRIGGTRTQRGFDEEFIFASAYISPTVEWRYLLTGNSYFSAFSDLTAFELRTPAMSADSAFLYAFGVGLTLETKVGIFALNYALGTRAGEQIQIRNAKIHFGYVSLF